jgi:hypothetical protein
MVLDSLADASETIYTMRSCGEMAPYGLALVGEAHLLDALRSLLTDRLVEAESEHVVADDRVGERPLAGKPATEDSDLRRYWFRMTPAGLKAWKDAADVLDVYWDTHPLHPAAGNDGVAHA